MAPGGRYCCRCEWGKYLLDIGSNASNCINAPTGYYVAERIAIVKVPYGFRAIGNEFSGKSECVVSPGSTNASRCSDIDLCPAGKYGTIPPTGVCFSCPTGFYSLTGLTRCDECSKGSYQNNKEQPACNVCPAGYFQRKTQQTSCDKCNPGLFMHKNGSASCTECEAGKHQSNTKQTSCITCPINYYQDFTKQIECKRCKLGQYTKNQTTAKTCIVFPMQDSVSPPQLLSLRPFDRASTRLKLSYIVPEDIMKDNKYDSIVIQWSTQPNLAEQIVKQSTSPDHLIFIQEYFENFRAKSNHIITTLKRSKRSYHHPSGELVLNVILSDKNESTKTNNNDNNTLAIKSPWHQKIYVRVAYKFISGETSRWTIENEFRTTALDCLEKSGVQYYLRTHPHDNTCKEPIDFLGLDISDNQTLKCIPCPMGGSCNSQSAGGIFIWNVAPMQGWWRIKWAASHGDIFNNDGDLIQSPQWFHECPHKEACLGVAPSDTFGPNGWSRSNIGIKDQRNWTCPEPLPESQCLYGTTGPLCTLCVNGFVRINGACVECFEVETRISFF